MGRSLHLLHTADWHLGKTLKGVDYTSEIAKALENLLEEVGSLEGHHKKRPLT